MIYNELRLFPCGSQLGSNLKYAMFYHPFIHCHKLSLFLCRIFTLATLEKSIKKKKLEFLCSDIGLRHTYTSLSLNAASAG